MALGKGCSDDDDDDDAAQIAAAAAVEQTGETRGASKQRVSMRYMNPIM
jgi:hypothetical protein